MSEQFNYKYSAPTEQERKEIASIRKQYVQEEKEMTDIERLRFLDSKVKNTAIIVSLCLGVIGCLIFGLGLTMVLEWSMWFWGVLCMVIGAFPMIIAYPAYNFYIEKGKAKYGQEIIELSEKLLK